MGFSTATRLNERADLDLQVLPCLPAKDGIADQPAVITMLELAAFAHPVREVDDEISGSNEKQNYKPAAPLL